MPHLDKDWLVEFIYAEKKKKVKRRFLSEKSLKDIPARNIIPTHKTFVSKQFQKKSVSFSASLYLHDEFSSSWWQQQYRVIISAMISVKGLQRLFKQKKLHFHWFFFLMFHGFILFLWEVFTVIKLLVFKIIFNSSCKSYA